MSSQIKIKLKHKGQSHEDAITLMWLSTTPTRELSREVSLVYNGGKGLFEEQVNHEDISDEQLAKEKEYGNYVALSSEKLDEIIHFYEHTIEGLIKELEDRKNQIKMLNEMMPKVISVDIYHKMREDIEELDNHIEGINEMINEYEHIKNKWEYSVQDVFEDNKDYSSPFSEYELIYYRD